MANKTTQSNIKKFDNLEITKHALFLNGVDSRHDSLAAYNPQKSGFTRIFILQSPKFMEFKFKDETTIFNHLLETAAVTISGIGDLSLEFEPMQGGIPGDSIELPTISKENTNEIQIELFDPSGSPIREYITLWITGIADKKNGYGRYHGVISDKTANMGYSQANHTMEALMVATDPTGYADNIEWVGLLTNMVPKGCDKSHYNYASAQVTVVKYTIAFTCKLDESAQINSIGKALLTKYQVLTDYLDYESGYTAEEIEALPEKTIV